MNEGIVVIQNLDRDHGGVRLISNEVQASIDYRALGGGKETSQRIPKQMEGEETEKEGGMNRGLAHGQRNRAVTRRAK